MPQTTRRSFLASMACLVSSAALPAGVWARPADAPLPAPMPAPMPALMLAQDAPAGIDPTRYLVSEKYDGVRAVWDGNALRFRSGRRVAAPAWFTARLPATPLDGELWLGRGQFDALSAAVRRQLPDDGEWRHLSYMLFDLPGNTGPFAARTAALDALASRAAWPQLRSVPQFRVASGTELQRRLGAVVAGGGEGLMLHRADAVFVPGRSPALLKLKPLYDAEALVLRHVAGRGKHAGRMGALQVRTETGIEFRIGTGFSDAERENPPPVGATITYTYRGTTPAGVPRFASYLRLRDI